MAARLSDADFEKLREHSAKSMPLDFFDTVMGTRGEKQKPSPKRPSTDPSQIDLF